MALFAMLDKLISRQEIGWVLSLTMTAGKTMELYKEKGISTALPGGECLSVLVPLLFYGLRLRPRLLLSRPLFEEGLGLRPLLVGLAP